MAAPYAHLGVRYIPLGGLTVVSIGEYLVEPSVLALGGSVARLAQDHPGPAVGRNPPGRRRRPRGDRQSPTQRINHASSRLRRDHGARRPARPSQVSPGPARPHRRDLWPGPRPTWPSRSVCWGRRHRWSPPCPNTRLLTRAVDRLRGLGVDTRLNSPHGCRPAGIVLPGDGRQPAAQPGDLRSRPFGRRDDPASAYDWGAIFGDATWFHVTGITPALSKIAAETTLAAVREAKQRG